MANLVQSDYSHENVVHTSAYYLFGHNTHFHLSQHQSLADAEVQASKELALYNRFGANNYFEFITIIRNLFTPGFEKDREILASFAPDAIEKDFENFRTGTLSGYFEKDIKIYFRSDPKNKKFQKAFQSFTEAIVGLGGRVTTKGPLAEITLNLGSEAVKVIKEFLNKMYSKQLHYSNKSFTKTLQDILAKKMSDGEINIVHDVPGNKVTELTHQVAIDNFPWGYKQKDIAAAIADPQSQEAKAFTKAMYLVEEFIMNKCAGGTQSLIEAARGVYDKKIGENPLNFRFFTGAGGQKSSMLKAIKGSLGEFQSALMFEYFSRRLGTTSNIATIIGNLPAAGSELGKADLTLGLNQIVGVQVKNWGEYMQQEIKTTIHPIEFAKTMENGDDFLQFIANIYFNTSYKAGREQDMEQLREEINLRFQELQNHDIVAGLTDKVSFYLIEGKYLVPCSELLKLVAGQDGLFPRENVSITSAYKGKSDTDYHQLTLTGNNIWWEKDANNLWTPTQENEKTFKNLVSKSISIRTQMDLSGKLSEYNLLGI